jgi:hypothetical protein
MSEAERANVLAAASVERDGVHLRAQSRASAEENFAVTFGEGVMHGDEATFQQAVTSTPVRSLVAADVLENSLTASPIRSPYYKVWQNRIHYIRQTSREPALARINEIAQHSEDPHQLRDAVRLLAIFGEGCHFAALNRPLNIQLPNEPRVDDLLLNRLAMAPRIETMNLTGAKWIEPETYGRFAHSGLLNLSVQNSALNDRAMAQIAHIATLTRLNASGTALSDDSVPSLGRLSSLSDLFLVRTHISSLGRDLLRKLLPHTKIRF